VWQALRASIQSLKRLTSRPFQALTEPTYSNRWCDYPRSLCNRKTITFAALAAAHLTYEYPTGVFALRFGTVLYA
jgi:hypothetical protein